MLRELDSVSWNKKKNGGLLLFLHGRSWLDIMSSKVSILSFITGQLSIPQESNVSSYPI